MLIASLALATAQPTPDEPMGDEIVVLARKLESWRGRWKLRDSGVTCKTTRSTGDKAIDAIGCEAMVQCIAPIAPQFAALTQAKLSKDEINRRGEALVKEAGIGECVVARREAGIAALAAERRGKRT